MPTLTLNDDNLVDLDVIDTEEAQQLVPNSTARCVYCKYPCFTMTRHTRGFDEDTSIFNICTNKVCSHYGKIVATE